MTVKIPFKIRFYPWAIYLAWCSQVLLGRTPPFWMLGKARLGR